jgi:glycosyltransferase involved in cell wall biosynthesis
MGLIEALAYGVPAFVTRGTNMKDQIEETNAGWTCEGSVADIEESLLLMIKERTDLPMKGEAARQLSYNYDWNKLAFTFHEKINNLLSNI